MQAMHGSQTATTKQNKKNPAQVALFNSDAADQSPILINDATSSARASHAGNAWEPNCENKTKQNKPLQALWHCLAPMSPINHRSN
jgi:hypothetical protein